MIQLSQIWIYPLKSGRGIRLQQAEISPTGLAWDRRWMLVDPDGRFLTQREIPHLAKLELSLSDEVSQPGKLGFAYEGEQLELPLPPAGLSAWSGARVQVWRSTVAALIAPEAVNAWFSACFGRPLRLAFLPAESRRETNPDFAPGRIVSFADGYPYLLCNQASLDGLNARLLAQGEPAVGIERFRPNLVVAGAPEDAEDGWHRLQIAGCGFDVVKPCERCVIITTDQLTGEVGREPLRTLASYRKREGKVIFGQNLVADRDRGLLNVGMPVTVE